MTLVDAGIYFNPWSGAQGFAEKDAQVEAGPPPLSTRQMEMMHKCLSNRSTSRAHGMTEGVVQEIVDHGADLKRVRDVPTLRRKFIEDIVDVASEWSFDKRSLAHCFDRVSACGPDGRNDHIRGEHELLTALGNLHRFSRRGLYGVAAEARKA